MERGEDLLKGVLGTHATVRHTGDQGGGQVKRRPA